MGGCICFGVIFSSLALGSVVTLFDGTELDPNVNIDIPSGSSATYTLNSGGLTFRASGDLNMWESRNGNPFAWTEKPAVAVGENWYAETQLHFNTPAGYCARIAGLTLYNGPDGDGGSAAGMVFTFGLDQWDSNGVWVQGLGNNHPGDSENLVALNDYNSVFLRMEVTQNDVGENFQFMYKADAGDAWTPLGSLNADFPDSRVALFLKGSGGNEDDQSATFTYFNVGVIPEVGSSSMAVLGFALLNASRLRRRRL